MVTLARSLDFSDIFGGWGIIYAGLCINICNVISLNFYLKGCLPTRIKCTTTQYKIYNTCILPNQQFLISNTVYLCVPILAVCIIALDSWPDTFMLCLLYEYDHNNVSAIAECTYLHLTELFLDKALCPITGSSTTHFQKFNQQPEVYTSWPI